MIILAKKFQNEFWIDFPGLAEQFWGKGPKINCLIKNMYFKMIVNMQVNIYLTFLISKFPIFPPEESPQNLNYFEKNSFSTLHLNIRSLQRNFDSFYNLLTTLAWSCDNSLSHCLYKSSNYKRIHQVKTLDKGGGRGGTTLEII